MMWPTAGELLHEAQLILVDTQYPDKGLLLRLQLARTSAILRTYSKDRNRYQKPSKLYRTS